MIETLSAIDRSLFLTLNSWNALWLNPVMVFLSGNAIWLPFIIFLLWLAFRRLDRKAFWVFLLFMSLGVIASDVSASYLLKNIFERLRPCRLEELKALINNFSQKCGGKYGFVSSHAANSFCLLTFSFLALELKSKRYYLIWILPLIVSFSRIYLGVHYPGDILGGVLVGVSWGILLGVLFRRRRRLGCQSAESP